MGTVLFRFVKQVACTAQKCSDAALMQLSHPAGHGIAGWKHAVLLYLREHMNAEYAEVIGWAAEMDRVPETGSVSSGRSPLKPASKTRNGR